MAIGAIIGRNRTSGDQGQATVQAAIPDINNVSNIDFRCSATATMNIFSTWGVSWTNTPHASRGRVYMRSGVTNGKFVHLKTPTGIMAIVVAAADILGRFGSTAGVVWNNIPFYVGIVNLDDTDANWKFFITRNPCVQYFPTTGNYIGKSTAAPVTNYYGNVVILDSTVTVADYINKPCIIIGSFLGNISAADAFTFTVGNYNIGLNKFHEGTWFTMPIQQNGASASRWFYSLSTLPQYVTNTAYYQVFKNGWVRISYYFNGDGGQEGAGANLLYAVLPCPLMATGQTTHGVLVGNFVNSAVAAPVSTSIATGSYNVEIAYQSTLATVVTSLTCDLQNSATGRLIALMGTYPSFRIQD